jgi:hypothetical protein
MAYKKGFLILLAVIALRGEDDEGMPDIFDELSQPETVSLFRPPFDLDLFLDESPQELQEEFEALSDEDKEALIAAIEIFNKAFVAEMVRQLESLSQDS